jgi:transposase-like protein
MRDDMLDPVAVGRVVAELRMQLDMATKQRDHWRKLAQEEREDKVRMADVALAYGAHGADCIHHQRNDCNCGLWRELGMVG